MGLQYIVRTLAEQMKIRADDVHFDLVPMCASAFRAQF